jgi:putative transposase
MTAAGTRCVHKTYPKAKKVLDDKTIPAGPPIQCSNDRKEDNDYFCTKHEDKGSLGISYSAFLSLPKLRPLVMKSDSDIPDGSKDAWQKTIPYDTRQGAIKELLSAYESAFALKKNGHIQHFKIKYKRKTAPKQVIHCRANAFDPGTSTIFKTRLKKGRGRKLRIRKRDLSMLVQSDGEEEHGDFTIQKMSPGAWYLCIPRKTKKEKLPPVYENAAYKSVFIDPGVRTFATYYSPDGVCGKIGDRFCEKFIDKLAFRIDALKALEAEKMKDGSKCLKYSGKTRAHMADRRALLRNKIKHKTDDLHWKTCTFLCTAFRNIFIPHFGTKNMVRREGRVINCLTTRRMLELSHGRFLERLKYVAKTKQRNVIEVPEAYTTKTCGACGTHNHNVGASKVFNCVVADCPYKKMDRDEHGARNIAISTMARMRRHVNDQPLLTNS